MNLEFLHLSSIVLLQQVDAAYHLLFFISHSILNTALSVEKHFLVSSRLNAKYHHTTLNYPSNITPAYTGNGKVPAQAAMSFFSA
jgi:hypothetical protein